jgi:hypothetical protein
MFVHFNTEKSAKCDNCSNPSTIMHLSVKSWNRSINFCVVCFWALAQAMNHASKRSDRSNQKNGIDLFGVSIRLSNQWPPLIVL